MSLDIKLGSYSFGNYIDTFEITQDSRVEQVAIPRRHGYLSDTGYKGWMSIRVGGMIYNDDYNTSRTHFNLLKNAFQLGKATLTIFSDRQVEVQKTSFSCSYEDQDLRRIRWDAELVSDDFGFVDVNPTVDLNSILATPQTDVVINSGNLETDAVIRIQGGLNGISSGLRIDNLTSGKYFTFNQAIPGKTYIEIDTDLLTVENQAGTNKLNYFSGDFFKLVAGNNSIKWTGAVDAELSDYQQSIQFSYRSKYDGH